MKSNENLLIVDNTPFSMVTIHRLEKKYGLRIAYASSAEEGLRMLDGVQFVVSNFELQGIHGIDFLLRAKQCTPGLKFALFTGKRAGTMN